MRPPLAAGRLRFLDPDHLTFALKNTWSNGTTHLIRSPQELIEKLAALVPPPRLNLVRYHGVLAHRLPGLWRPAQDHCRPHRVHLHSTLPRRRRPAGPTASHRPSQAPPPTPVRRRRRIEPFLASRPGRAPRRSAYAPSPPKALPQVPIALGGLTPLTSAASVLRASSPHHPRTAQLTLDPPPNTPFVCPIRLRRSRRYGDRAGDRRGHRQSDRAAGRVGGQGHRR